MSLTLLSCTGGHLVLPDRSAVLLSAGDGGHLIVLPPRPVWERGQLEAKELANWAYLVAAAGSAMLDVLPQLAGGCINYWEAGNWALNDLARPAGRKRPHEHRRVHLHLLGRSPESTDPAWKWGESPRFPEFAERETWALRHSRIAPDSCRAIAEMTDQSLRERYGMNVADIPRRTACAGCGYVFVADGRIESLCDECRPVGREL